jgi:hypothetical protein
LCQFRTHKLRVNFKKLETLNFVHIKINKDLGKALA